MTFKHPGIDMVHNMRQQRGYTDDWEVNEAIDQDILSNLRQSKAFLDRTMQNTQPAQIKDEDIHALRKFEVAIAYAGLTDPESPASSRKLKQAINGLGALDQPNDSTLYANRKEHALAAASRPATRVATSLDF